METIASIAELLCHHKLCEYAQRAAKGGFLIPIARIFPFEEWRTGLEISLSSRSRGKLVLQIAAEAAH